MYICPKCKGLSVDNDCEWHGPFSEESTMEAVEIIRLISGNKNLPSGAELAKKYKDMEALYVLAGGDPAFTRQLERDIRCLLLKLYMAWEDDPLSFAPESTEVMERWKPEIEKMLRGEQRMQTEK